MLLKLALGFIAATTLATGLQAAAATRTAQTTDLDLYPYRIAFCEKKDYPLVSTAFDIQKTSETSTRASFEFTMRYGSCSENKFFTKVIRQSPWVIQIVADKKFNQKVKTALETRVIHTAQDEIRVEITVDKNKMFDQSSSVHHTLYFTPSPDTKDFVVYRVDGSVERDPRRSVNFPWHLILSQTAREGLALRIQQ